MLFGVIVAKLVGMGLLLFRFDMIPSCCASAACSLSHNIVE